MSIESPPSDGKPVQDLTSATVRFAGDSGDGMQLTGTQFTNASAVFGNDVSTLPDYPAEIRAPVGTVYGVSGYQLHFSSQDIFTPGDELDTLVAMNPAALKVNVGDLKSGGMLIVNEDGFNAQNLKLAGYAKNPLEDGSLGKYRVFQIRMTTATVAACEEFGVIGKDAARCKNFYALGVVCWLYNRPLEPIIDFINDKFGKTPEIRNANIKVLNAGYYYGETEELFQNNFQVQRAKLPPGTYREIQGNECVALGLIAASQLCGKPVFYGSYPITPASDILHELAKHKEFGVKTFQAEDEIAAVCSALGASFGGALGVTASAGPGIALKAEAMGLGVMLELPLIVVNVQRGGPATGLPTKVEQADLLQVMFGRNGECPMPVLAPRTPSDCFDITIMAVRIAFRYMTPVVILSDGYIANSAEPWLVPNVADLEKIHVEHPEEPNGPDGAFLPYLRDENLARPWALPGTPGLVHRLGGLEKEDPTGNVCYRPDNHQHMVDTRQAKVDKVAEFLPEQEIFGDKDADLLIVGWGSTYGAIREATTRLRGQGRKVANIHIRYLNPFPRNLGTILHSYKQVLVPELNKGQLALLLRAKYLVDTKGLNKVQGRPFNVREIVEAAEALLEKEVCKA
ncbi:2-oxoacid:acceptor oxidoreductase subunit alpha [Candidatus Poribacteria bacterium]|nr:2-oxoacid:acceptor oxidoreductase subunit alpha [Candidatus Poribacteria bacterium]